jgi:hypothetical protein
MENDSLVSTTGLYIKVEAYVSFSSLFFILSEKEAYARPTLLSHPLPLNTFELSEGFSLGLV